MAGPEAYPTDRAVAGAADVAKPAGEHIKFTRGRHRNILLVGAPKGRLKGAPWASLSFNELDRIALT